MSLHTHQWQAPYSPVRCSAFAIVNHDAAGLMSVLRFVRDTPGAEALGVGYAAAYLKAVPAAAMTAEPLDALGTLADRLALRAASRRVSRRPAPPPLPPS